MVILLYLVGGLDWLELKTLDLRFRYANSIPEHPDIVCIDIDDASLTKVGRWPWPRDEQAAMISVLAEIGARAILVDLTFSEPEPVRPRVPKDADLVTDPLELTGEELDLVFPDDELRAAIAGAANVYLAAYYDPDAWDRSARFRATVAALGAAGPGPESPARRGDRSHQPSQELWQKARIALALEKDPLADDRTVVQQLGLDWVFVREAFERCRQYALRDYVRGGLAANPAWWNDAPQTTVRALYGELTKRPFEDETPLRAALLAAFREVLSHEATLRWQPPSADRLRTVAVEADAVVPVYFPLARAARGCGFVSFEPDEGGVIRRCAPFAIHHGRLLTQLAFAVACDVLGMSEEDITVRADRLVLEPRRPGRPRLSLQLDRRGRILIPWVKRTDWTRQFGPHVPADTLWTVHDRRRQMEHNDRLLRESRYALFGGNLFQDHREYRRKLAQLRQAERAYREARYRGTPDEARQRHADLLGIDRELVALERGIIEGFRAERPSLDTQPTTDTVDEVRFVLEQVARLEEDGSRVAAANGTLQYEVDETLAWLRGRAENRICLIGYTATSLADMKPIPTQSLAPGVVAHANLLNGLLTGHLVRWASKPTNAALAGLCGILAGLVGIWHGPRLATGLIAALLLTLLGVAGAGAFYRWTYWVALTPALGAMLVSYSAVTLYGYGFLERERRQLTAALGQYTSATLAQKMAEDPDLCRRAETREVTVMFTDLRGFTTISERIGAERTQRVLNLCLGRCSEVMLRYEAMINKFIGDGIFAFWNPVIYPQPDHAVRACETALELQAALRDLIEEQRRIGGDDAFAELVLRIGLASGPAVVGPCGSEQKYDYTCIGDTVNLAARLESANKFYGTRVLVGGDTGALVGTRFVFRPLGGVQVKGKTRPVPIWELLGRSGEVSDAAQQYANQFGQAVTLFQQRRWEDARTAFEACSQHQPDDLAATRYLDATRRFRAAPPPEDWSGALELAEK